MTRFYRTDLVLISILTIGFTLRIVGLGVGLPDRPDPREPLIAQDILNLINLASPPEIYNWPGTAWFYLIALIGRILEDVWTKSHGFSDYLAGSFYKRPTVNGDYLVDVSGWGPPLQSHYRTDWRWIACCSNAACNE